MADLFSFLYTPPALEPQEYLAVPEVPAPKRRDELRDYQLDVLNRGRQRMATGLKRGIIQGQTGSGKTHILCEMIRCAVAKGKRCLIIADRRRLIKQIGETLDVFHVPYGIIMSGETRNVTASVIVSSRDTLTSWVKNGLTMMPYDLIAIDECIGE